MKQYLARDVLKLASTGKDIIINLHMDAVAPFPEIPNTYNTACGTSFAESIRNHCTVSVIPVSYTHLTLPTNREV